MWNAKEIEELAEENFEKAWMETKNLLPKKNLDKIYPLTKVKQGKPHILFETIQKLREAYIKLGFEEVVNPIFIEEKEVYKQFGNEAQAILDRCYYLAGLPRPDVGMSEEKIEKLKKIVEIDDKKIEKLREVLHAYKKGAFGGDDLIYKIAEVIETDDVVATRVLNEVFPEFKELKPIATRITLRSHMTSGWFLTLASLIGKKPLPIKLFSIDRCFRREQREDETHLRSYFSASCVVVSEDVTVEDGKLIAEALLENFGFTKFKFKLDEKRSKYYAPDTQTEVYAYSSKTGWVEIATFGIYSPVALSRYKIEYPVLNLGLGVERLAMVLENAEDVRELIYPQFYKEITLSDREIASMLKLEETPRSKEGFEIAESIIKACEEHADAESPCEFLAYRGKIFDRTVEVKVVEREENQKLLGPAAFNKIYIIDGNIYGLAQSDKGLFIGLRYIDAIAYKVASLVEKNALVGNDFEYKVKIVRNLGDINLRLDEAVLRYITTKKKKIDVRGPVFITVTVKYK